MAIVATLSGGVVAATADDEPTREPDDEVRLSCCCGVSPGTEDDEGCLEVIVSGYAPKNGVPRYPIINGKYGSSTVALHPVNLFAPGFLSFSGAP